MGVQSVFGEAVDRIGGEPIASRMARKAPLRHIDPVLLAVSFLLAAYGAVMVWSATVHAQEANGLDPNAYLFRQTVYIILGALLFVGVTLFDYRHLKDFAPIFYGITSLGLLLVLTPLGTVSKGASRWISLGFFQVQPAELGKVAVILILAAYFAERKGAIQARHVAAGIGMVAVLAGLVYLEPDLGTMLVFIAISVAVLFVAGAKVRHLLTLALLGLFGIFMVIQLGLLQDYQVERITSFLNPKPDVQSSGYNLYMSKIAIGSGGIRGKGLEGQNTQTSLDYVPEQHTDFIFTAVGEQLGFMGAALLLALFALLIWRALRIATMARDMFGTLIAAGLAAFWGFEIFVNIGMTMGIMPITGIPLPFISYGGSSMLTNFLGVGILMNIHMRRYL